MVTVDIVDDVCHAENEEEKVSSSSKRKRLLGTLIHPLTVRICFEFHDAFKVSYDT